MESSATVDLRPTPETRPRLTLAVNHYDRHVPFLDGTVQPEGIDLQTLVVGQSVPGPHGADRHERMLNKGEFDIAEISLSSFLMAKDQAAPFAGIPVFPRRLFSCAQMYVRAGAGIRQPADLAGRRVGLSSYQTTLSVLAKGDLEHVYGVPWKSLRWVTQRPEVMAFQPPAGISLETAPEGKTLNSMLLSGEIDALMAPHPPAAFLNGDARISRLFPDPKAEEARYARTRGYYPIMHLVTARDDVVARYPWVARSMYDAFERARQVTWEYYDDPNWSLLAWGRQALEEERALFGRDPWANGVKTNRANLEAFIGYSLEQGLISRRLSIEELFYPSTLDS